MLFEMIRVAVVAILHRKDGARIIGTGMLLFTIVLLWIIFHMIFARMGIWPDLPMNFAIALVSFGILGLLISMSLFLSRSFALTHKSLERKTNELGKLNVELEDRVERRTAELAAANNTLETKNAQLSESYKKLDTAHTQLREAQTQLVQSEKMAALGHLVAGIAHEINNPVGAVHSAADVSNRAIRKIKETLEASQTSAPISTGSLR